MVEKHQQNRAKITDDVVKQFMAIRPLKFSGTPQVSLNK